MRIVISIFVLPYEIDDLENTLNQLKRASYYLKGTNEYMLDVTLGLSDQLINWRKSSLPKSYFEDKLLKLSSQTDWCAKSFQTSDDIMGCVSQRRKSLIEQENADFYIWLDTDIIFDERTLLYMENAMSSVKKFTPYTVITPEVVKLWDTTWDCLVNEEFLEKPTDYQKTNDPYKDSGVKGNIMVEGVQNQIQGQPRFKFAGGWFTCISAPLLKKIGVPESFGHYGYEDTFVMWASEKLIQVNNVDIKQFKIKNLVVCENYKYRSNYHYVNNLSVYDRREQFKQIAQSKFQEEMDKIN